MKSTNNHIEQFEKQSSNDFFEQVSIPYKESKDAMWNRLESQIVEKDKFRFTSTYKALAAGIALLIIAGVSSLFFTKDIICPKGSQLSYTLPDNSKVLLNADSKISYYPIRSYFTRALNLNGEAFFEVKKGKKFVVTSSNGKTEVLGTSFNIYNRNKDYIVTCQTGKVRVTNKNDQSTTLQAKEIARSQRDGLKKEIAPEESIAWKNNQFLFQTQTLQNVFQEIERRYNILIEIDKDKIKSIKYSGRFQKAKSPKKILDLICNACALQCKVEANNVYRIIESK